MGPSPLKTSIERCHKLFNGLASDDQKAIGGVRPASLSCPVGSREGVGENKTDDTVLMQRAGASRANASEKVTAARLGDVLDNDYDSERIEVRSGGCVQPDDRRDGGRPTTGDFFKEMLTLCEGSKLRPEKADLRGLEAWVIPETPPPKVKGIMKGWSLPRSPPGEGGEAPPPGTFKGKTIARTPPSTCPSTLMEVALEQETRTGPADVGSAYPGQGDHRKDPSGPSREARPKLRDPVVALDRGKGDQLVRLRASSASRVDDVAGRRTSGWQARGIEFAVPMVPLIRTKERVKAPSGDSTLEARTGGRMAEVATLLNGLMEACARMTDELSSRKPPSTVVSAKAVLGFVNTVSRVCGKVSTVVAETAAIQAITLWKEGSAMPPSLGPPKGEEMKPQPPVLQPTKGGGKFNRAPKDAGTPYDPPKGSMDDIPCQEQEVPGNLSTSDSPPKKQSKAKRPRTSPQEDGDGKYHDKKRANVEVGAGAPTLEAHGSVGTESRMTRGLLGDGSPGLGLFPGPSVNGPQPQPLIQGDPWQPLLTKGQKKRARREQRMRDMQAQKLVLHQLGERRTQQWQLRGLPSPQWPLLQQPGLQQQQRGLLRQQQTAQQYGQQQLQQQQQLPRQQRQQQQQHHQQQQQQQQQHQGGSLLGAQTLRRPANRADPLKLPPVRKRPEAVLVKVAPSSTYIDTYKLLLAKGRETLAGVKGVKKTRLGHVLLEVEKNTSAESLVRNIRDKLGDGLKCSPL